MSADGTWNTTINSPMGAQNGTMTLATDGGTLTGKLSGPQGDIDIEDGAVDGDNLTWKASVLYTSNPQDPGNALIYVNQPLTAKTISFTRWTGYADISFDITPLSRQVVGSALYDDGSFFLTASNTYSLTDNWQLLVVWQHFDGPGDSLFGENPADVLYGRIRWSF